MAYYFNWARGDIMGMTGRERKTWLSQIKRIHKEQKQIRDRELVEQMGFITKERTRENEA